MAQAPTQGHGDEAERLFGEWLARQPAPTSADEASEFAAFCNHHADHAATLRRLYADFGHIAGLLDRLGLSISAAPGGRAQTTVVSAPHPSLAQRIRDRHGSGVDPVTTLDPEGAAASTGEFSSKLLARLSSRPDASVRYHIQGEVDRGGQGMILRVWDEDLRRHLAMKLTLGRVRQSTATPAVGGAQSSPAATTPPIDVRTVGRFLEEAQVTGQLDHPGIVPVHELGLDAQGRVFFTMKLVKGEDLKTVFARVHAGEKGWTITHVLSMMLKVCEAMSYAHAKGVIHRDLKPSNIMVGHYGEVFVMDWGLARVLGRPDDKDIRVRPPDVPTTSELQSERHERAATDPNSPLITMDGDVVGTPAYMSPEQAKGRLDVMGPPSDVYALGAMLYHLLTGRMPYVTPDARVNNYAILSRVQEGPPASVASLAPHAPAELGAICEKAMARDPVARYEDMSVLAEDLRAYLERRVVAAYEMGAVAELRKWIMRNKPLAAALAVGVLLLASGLTTSLIFKARSDINAALASENATQAEAASLEAQRQETAARREKNNVLRLSAFQRLEDLCHEADALWPATPDLLPHYDSWMARAATLVAGLEPSADGSDPGHRRQLELLRDRALAQNDKERVAERTGQPAVGEEVPTSRPWRFTSEDDAWWHNQLTKLIAEIEAFADPATGLVEGVSETHGWGIARRREFAATVENRTLTGDEAVRRWSEAVSSIADSDQCPAYGRLMLAPQLGLLPIGRDSASGLWEFWHVPSGDEPLRGANGTLVLTESTGVVLVLIPGGTFWMGAQKTDPSGQNYDLHAEDKEGPVHEVALSPYFLSKYELTQGQWIRFTGTNPSAYRAGTTLGEHMTTLIHPVEQVSWSDAMTVLPRLGLDLPTEAQWERAARGGTHTPWSTGWDRESLIAAANLADQAAARGGATWTDIKEWLELDDGWVVHAAVGTFRPNAFGLHDVHGNLWEWCRDAYDGKFYAMSPEKDPFMATSDDNLRIFRGGSYRDNASTARSAYRNYRTPGYRVLYLGLRPAKSITR